MVGRVAIAVAFATRLAAPAAHAHIRSGVVAVDYRASVYPLNAAEPSSIRARIYESDRALGSQSEAAIPSSSSDTWANRFSVSGPAGSPSTLPPRRLGPSG
jgi:hypothetical protein